MVFKEKVGIAHGWFHIGNHGLAINWWSNFQKIPPSVCYCQSQVLNLFSESGAQTSLFKCPVTKETGGYTNCPKNWTRWYTRRRSVKRKSLYPQCVFMMMINTAAKCVQWIISPRRCPIGKKRKKSVWSESQNEIHLKCKSDRATPPAPNLQRLGSHPEANSNSLPGSPCQRWSSVKALVMSGPRLVPC